MSTLYNAYKTTVLQNPKTILAIFTVLLVVAVLRIDQFRLDASAESLVLENDSSLRDFRETSKLFSSAEDYLLVTYAPETELFSEQGLSGLRALRDELAAIEGVSGTNSILNVPLLHSPNLSLETVDSEILTIDEHNVAPQVAREALLDNPLYPDLLISRDAKTAAIQVVLHTPESYFTLFEQREDLKALVRSGKASKEDEEKLEQLNNQFIAQSEVLHSKQDALIEKVRVVLNSYRDKAQIFLGGVPMIVVDMISYIRSDISTFGIGVLLFLLLTLAIIFRQWRLVLVPMLCCSFTVWLVSGYLSWTKWPITVISSNFISLLLIMTLSLIVHLIVRYREFQQEGPNETPRKLLGQTIDAMIRPCFFMVITTIVAFCSFTLSDILPVIDFGWMMTIGLCIAFFITFVIFPSILQMLPPKIDMRKTAQRSVFTAMLARFTERHKNIVLILSITVFILSVIGISRLTVENSFINYFKSDTDIHQGMLAIDTHLGGTAPLDVVITDEQSTTQAQEECDPFLDEDCDEDQVYQNTWFTYSKIERLDQIHDYLNSLDETGKVLSLTTTLRMFEQINQDRQLQDIELAFVPQALPNELKEILLRPYVSEEERKVRFSIRLLDSLPELRRQQLLEKIKDHLVNELQVPEDRVLLTGITVLYNNMLQSLFDSQIKTLSVVFFAIMIMFLILFRSLALAVIGIIPNLLAAGALLGLIGWLNIPLDIMTITVAAITVGIAVDNTIHYIHRFKVEIVKDGDYIAAMHRCHGSIGRAMFYTSLTIIIGFSILVLSNFIPTIYFGLFTGFAMFVALLGALALLPTLLITFKPFGKKLQAS